MEKVKENNPQKIKERLEKTLKKVQSVDFVSTLTGVASSAVFIGGIVTLLGGHNVPAELMEASYAAAAVCLNVCGITTGLKKKYHEKIGQIRAKLDPEKYYPELLQKEQFKLEKEKEIFKNTIEDVDSAKADMLAQKERVDTLKAAHSAAKTCRKEKTVRRLTDIAAKGERTSGALLLVAGSIAIVPVACTVANSIPAVAAVSAGLLVVAAKKAVQKIKNDKASRKALSLMQRLTNHWNNLEKQQ